MTGYISAAYRRSEALSIDELFQRGISFATGRTGKIDLIEAHKWFNLAAAKGQSSAAHHREEIASEMSKEEIAEALRAAREWLASQ
jgi:TPR repeat protein